MPDASIVLLTYNGMTYLPQVLEMIRRQNVRPEKVIAIDSESSDGTKEFLKQQNDIETHCIPKNEFSHSKTRNFAVRLVQTPFIVFLTQDATPADSCWLQQLLKPFQDYTGIAGVFSRQIPRPDPDLLEANDLRIAFGEERLIKTIPADASSYRKRIWHYIRFSNSSSAYDRKLLQEYSFQEQLAMGEDQEWAKRMLEAGHKIVYEPASVVLHSHKHTLRQKYERNLEMGKAFSMFVRMEAGKRRFPLIEYMYNIAIDFLYILADKRKRTAKLKWLLLSPIHRAVMHYAFYQGWKSKRDAHLTVSAGDKAFSSV